MKDNRYYPNIEALYVENRSKLLEDDTYRPCKSVTRDVEKTIERFKEKFNKDYVSLNKTDILNFFEVDVLNDTHNTNLRVMREFGFLNINNNTYEFTDKYKNFVKENISAGEFILNELYAITSISDINMYLNTILCTLREGYLNGEIIEFPDSIEKFKVRVPDANQRYVYRKQVKELYGFSSRGKSVDQDEYTPNANYRVLTELKKLNLIKDKNRNDSLASYVLTNNAYHLLKTIDKNIEEYKDFKKLDAITVEKGYNKIFYGIPGCGKSYHVEHIVLKNANKQNNVFRTTFYLDYSNSDFIGQIYPHVEVNDKGEKIVTYKNVPGPFTKALKRAFEAPNEMIYLVIEEINRGNAAAIFGDTFQLLDRLQASYDGRIPGDSEYPISNEFIESYLGDLVKKGQVFIPHNLTILATMNTSDQNVFPLDTAFKRRWDLEKVVNDWSTCDLAKLCIPFTDITWENFAKTINVRMIQANESGEVIINEDKKLGAYFATKDMLVEKDKRHDDTPENRTRLKKFVTNVVDYLFNDVTKFDHTALFKEKVTFDDIYNQVLEYELTEHDIDVFHSIFKEKVEPDVKDDE